MKPSRQEAPPFLEPHMSSPAANGGGLLSRTRCGSRRKSRWPAWAVPEIPLSRSMRSTNGHPTQPSDLRINHQFKPTRLVRLTKGRAKFCQNWGPARPLAGLGKTRHAYPTQRPQAHITSTQVQWIIARSYKNLAKSAPSGLYSCPK